MLFKSHTIGGAISAGGMYLIATQLTINNSSVFTLNQPNLVTSPGFLACITLLMSLLPDVDTKSIPQKYLSRILVVMLACLAYFKLNYFFSALAFILPLSLMGKHRGYMHHKLAPWVLFLIIFSWVQFYKSQTEYFYQFNGAQLIDYLTQYWPVLGAMVIGHYTHLFLDRLLLS